MTKFHDKSAVSIADISKAVGEHIEDTEQLAAVLKRAAKNNDAETEGNVRPALEEAITKLANAVGELKQIEKHDANAMSAKAVEESSLKKLFAEAKTPEERDEIMLKAVNEFGMAGVISLAPDTYHKQLLTPISPRVNKNFEQQNAFRRCHDQAIIAAALKQQTKQNGEFTALFPRESMPAVTRREVLDYGRKLAEINGSADARGWLKAANDALDSVTAGDGAEFVPTVLSARIVDNIYIEARLIGLLERMFMPTPTFNLPYIPTPGRAYLMPEANAPANFWQTLATPHPFDTDQLQLVAKKPATLFMYSAEATEDSLPDLVAAAERYLVLSHARSLDDALMNANRSDYGTGLDNAAVSKLWTSTSDIRYINNGIRYWAHDVANAGANARLLDTNGTLTTALILNARKLLGKWGTDDPSRIPLIVSPSSLVDMMKLTEALTFDKIRDRATVLTGQISEFLGHPVIASEFAYSNLNASGVYDNSVTTKTIIAMFHRDNYVVGDRRMFTVQREFQMMSQQWALLGLQRMDMKKLREDETTEAVLYDLAA